MKHLLAALGFLALATPAFAVCPSPLTGKDGGGTLQNFGVTVDGSGNCYGNISIVDGTNAANKATVNASGQLLITGPVTNAGTFAVQATLQASSATAIGTVNPTTAANWGLGATGTAVPANAQYVGIISGGNLTGWTGAVTNAGTFAVQLNATPSLANGNGVVPTQGGSVLSATNGWFGNILQGNAVLSATNGLFGNILQGNAVLSATNPIFVSPATSALFANNVTQWDSTALGVPTAYGIAPTSGNYIGVNAFVTNASPLGAAAAASSSPVTLPILAHASVTSLGTSLVAKNAAGQVNAFNCTAITGGAAGYCILYNATTAPSTGALTGSLVLDACYFDTTPRGCSIVHANGSIAVSAGAVILATSAATPLTYTTGTDTAYIEADYN